MDPISSFFLFILGTAVVAQSNEEPVYPWDLFLDDEVQRHQVLGIQIWNTERIAWDRMQQQGLLPPGWAVDENGRAFHWRDQRITEEKLAAVPELRPFMRNFNEVLARMPSWAPYRNLIYRHPSRVGEFTFEGFGPSQFLAFVQRFITDRLKIWMTKCPEILDEYRAIDAMIETDLGGFLQALSGYHTEWIELGDPSVRVMPFSSLYHLARAMEIDEQHGLDPHSIYAYPASGARAREVVRDRLIEVAQDMLPNLLEVAKSEREAFGYGESTKVNLPSFLRHGGSAGLRGEHMSWRTPLPNAVVESVFSDD